MDKKNSKITDALLLFLLCWMAYAVIYIGRKNFSACMSAMIADGLITKITGGTAGTAFLAVYATGQLINGFAGDRISPRFMVSVGLLGAGTANVLMSRVSLGAVVPVLWGINGFFCSMLWSPILRCVSEGIPEHKRASAGVAISATIPAGAILSYLLCSLLLNIADWRSAFFVSGMILIAAGAVFFVGMTKINRYLCCIMPRKISVPGKKDGAHPPKTSFLMLVLTTGLAFAVIGILFNGILKDGLDMWVPTYIHEFFGIKASLAALLTAILPVVNLSGAVAARYANEKWFKNEMFTAAFFFFVSIIAFIPLFLITLLSYCTLVTAIFSIVLISVITASMLAVNTMFLTFIPFQFSSIGYCSTVTGFLNACSYAAASLSGITIGIVSAKFGWLATISSFALCGVLGAAVCLVGSRRWGNGVCWGDGVHPLKPSDIQ